MSKESYARGFCKTAEAAGVDPVQLAKYAQNGIISEGPTRARAAFDKGFNNALMNPGAVGTPLAQGKKLLRPTLGSTAVGDYVADSAAADVLGNFASRLNSSGASELTKNWLGAIDENIASAPAYADVDRAKSILGPTRKALAAGQRDDSKLRALMSVSSYRPGLAQKAPIY